MPRFGLISIGVFLIICGVAIISWLAGILARAEVLPIVIILLGVWVFVIAAVKAIKPVAYERGAFQTACFGAIAVIAGLLLELRVKGIGSTAVWAIGLILIGALFVIIAAHEWIKK